MTLEELSIQGKINIHKSMAASIADNLIGIRKETIKQCMSDFHNEEHRLESVANIAGIEFVNDSKATNVNTTWYSLEEYNHPVIWIAGGTDNGNDYSKLLEIAKRRVKTLICLGVNNAKIIETFSPYVKNIVETTSMEDAVNYAYSVGEKGDTVLLSPACASFDLYSDYKERGKAFRNAVQNL
jgi:UDP-N-acetylmuramoylalanine--D-glutamate ligase